MTGLPMLFNAVQVAKDIGISIIGFSGFMNSELEILSDVNIHIPSDNYGIIEDIHGIILHSLAQRIRSTMV